MLETATREILTSEGFRRWCSTRDKFHDYSIGNQILIAMQRPDATRVAGYRKWQSMDRQVRKGERGIRILAPIVKKVENEQGDEEKRAVWFKLVSVFDVSQTDGEPLPTLPARRSIAGDEFGALEAPLLALAEEIGVGVEFDDLSRTSANGYFDPAAKQIVIDSSLSTDEAIRTLTHEIAHALGVGYAEYGVERAEVIVEAATHVALGTLGFDTSGESLTYLAVYGRENDLAVLRNDLGKINEIATRIEDACGVGVETPEEVAA